MSRASRRVFVCLVLFLLFAIGLAMPAFAQAPPPPVFTSGNLVVVVEGCGVHGGTCTNIPNGTGNGTGNSSVGGYGDNQGAPLTLFQYTPNGTSSVSFVNSLVLPQAGSGANLSISGEYGSSSEGTLQLAGTGQYLTIMEYGIDASTFDANPDAYGAAPSGALAQSGSLTGQSYTPVPRVLTLIDPYGNVNSSTAIYNIFNTNNPRSAYTLDGTTAYLSGQGSGSDGTGGVFYTAVGAVNTAPTAITGLDTSSKTIAQDTRDVQILNNTLYISVDSKEGSGNNRSFIGTLGNPPATGLYNNGGGPTMLTGYGNTGGTGKVTITTGSNSNGNNLNAGLPINLSPVNYFFASSSVLYVADSGAPKNDSNGDNNSTMTGNIGDGGLQKWINSKSDGTGTWSLAYTLYEGLNLLNNGSATGTSGLFGLTGTVSGNAVYLYATNYTLSDLDFTYLYGIIDNLSYTTASQASGEMFTLLDTAPPDSNFKGVSFAPTLPPGSATITSSPSGLAFTSTGAGCAPGTYTTPVTLIWTPGNSCTLSVVSPQTASGAQYFFSQWQDGTTTTTDTVTAPTTAAVYTASFTTTTSIAVTNVSPASEDYGLDAPVTITALLSWAGNGPAPTASNVSIGGNGPSSYGTTSCGVPSGDTMTCTNTYTPTLADAPGTYTESATFAGDSNFSASSSPQSGNFAINEATSTTTVTSSGSPSTYGQPVTFTATISGENGNVEGRTSRNGVKQQVVSGTVTWSANTGCSPTAVTSGNPGVATCTTSILPGGTDTITASYSGDSNHSGSTGTLSGGQVVEQAATSMAVTSVSPNSEDYGSTAPVSITAVLSWAGNGAAPTAGDVTIGGSGLGGSFGTTSCGAPSSDTMTCTNSYTPSGNDLPGSYTMTAAFTADENYSASSSPQSGNFAINEATSTTTVTSSGSPSTYGQPVTFTATISGENGNVKGRTSRNGVKQQVVSGTVTWSANTGCSPTAVTSGNPGVATCTTSILPGGTDTITASYSGDSNHSGSTGTLSGGQVVNQASQTITFTVNAPATAAYNSSFTVAASASSELTVTFTASGSCSNSGAMYTMTSGTGPCSVIANQGGNSNYSAAAPVTQTVDATLASQSITVTVPAPPTATLKSSFTVAATSTSGLPVTFSSSGGCTNSGGTYTMASSGSKACTEIMNAAANSNYSAAPPVTETTVVAKAITPTVSFTGAPATAQYSSTFTVVASSNSTSIPTFSTTGPCTIDSTTLLVTMTSGTGICTMTASWPPNDVYTAATAIQRTAAEKVASVVTWSNPAPITYGTPLSSTQLNATANTNGTFVYTPALGRILAAGLQSLSVRFTPSSISDYTTVTYDVELTVNPVDTTTTIISNTPNPSNVGKAVTFDVSVTQVIANPTKPPGTVTVSASSGESCTGNLGSGKGSCKITFETSGSRTITASYPGNANNNSSVSAAVTQTVN